MILPAAPWKVGRGLGDEGGGAGFGVATGFVDRGERVGIAGGTVVPVPARG